MNTTQNFAILKIGGIILSVFSGKTNILREIFICLVCFLTFDLCFSNIFNNFFHLNTGFLQFFHVANKNVSLPIKSTMRCVAKCGFYERAKFLWVKFYFVFSGWAANDENNFNRICTYFFKR